jgi:hypothetical protein
MELRYVLKMNPNSMTTLQQRFVLAAVLAACLIGCAGCQTFSLSQEDWGKQRRGEMVDRDAGDAVGIAGTAGYYGLVVGEAVAAALRK